MRDHERRDLNDRRDEDQGPPEGWRERRRHAERRIPQIEEQVLSEEEWSQYFFAPKKPPQPDAIDAELSGVTFNDSRIRNEA